MLKKSIQLMGHRTSIALEEEFWMALEQIAAAKNISLNKLIAMVDAEPKRPANLSSTLRVYALKNKDLFELPTKRKK